MIDSGTYPVVGELVPYMAGYGTFKTETIHGVARVVGKRLEFIVVMAYYPGHGDFRRFLVDCKQAYAGIAVWEIWNPRLRMFLRREGFEPAYIMNDDDDRLPVEGLEWKE